MGLSMRLASSSHKTAIYILAILVPSLGAQELKLEDALQLAIDHNRQLATAKLEVAKAGEQFAAFHANLFPAVKVSADLSQQLRPIEYTIARGQLGDYASTGPLPSNDVKLSTPLQPTGTIMAKVAQPLSGIYKVRLNLKALDLSKQIDQEKVRATVQDVTRDTKKLYYQIQQTESSLRVSRETLALYRELERITGDYVLKQVALEPDHLEAQTRLSRAEQDQLELEDGQANLKEQLNQLLGRDVLTEFTVTPIAEAAELALDVVAARARALEQRPELREARLKVQQAEQQVRIKKADYIPDVNAEFNALKLLNYSSFLPSQTASVGVTLSWTPVDWGRRKHEIGEAKYSADQSKNAEQDARSRIIVEVDAKYRQMRQVQAQFRVARLSQRTAIEQLRVSKARYSREAALLKEVLQVETNLEQANNDYQQTLAKFLAAQAEFEHAVGEDQ
jgi:outer membrane protein TolC